VTEAPHDLYRARVDDRDVRDIVEGRILHRDLFRRTEHCLERGVELSPRAVHPLLAGERIEPRGLHRGDEPYRLSLRRYPIVPAPRGHLLEIEAEHAIREMVAVVKIAEEPSVEAFFRESRLNLLDIHRSSLPVFGITPYERLNTRIERYHGVFEDVKEGLLRNSPRESRAISSSSLFSVVVEDNFLQPLDGAVAGRIPSLYTLSNHRRTTSFLAFV